jgi:transposase
MDLAPWCIGQTIVGYSNGDGERKAEKARQPAGRDAVWHLEDIRTLDAKLKNVRRQIMTFIETTGTHLPDLYDVGPVIAGRIIAEVQDIGRFPSKDHFASYNGTAPSTSLPASGSGIGSLALATGESTTPCT